MQENLELAGNSKQLFKTTLEYIDVFWWKTELQTILAIYQYTKKKMV